MYIFKDICPENIPIRRNGRNGDIVVVGDRRGRIRLDFQLCAVWLETPIARILLEIRASENIDQLLADIGRICVVYVDVYLEYRQRISAQLVPITGCYDIDIFIVFFNAGYIESREPGNAGLV